MAKSTMAKLAAFIGGRSALVLVWSCLFQIVATGFAAAASPVGPEFQVNGFTTTNQNGARVAMSSAGAFVVVWESDGLDNLPDYSYQGVFARRYDSSGFPLAPELQVNSFTVADQDQPAVAINTAGDFVVVWRSANQDGDSYGIFGQRFDSAGAPQGGEFQVNSFTTSVQAMPDVEIAANGAFVVVWQSYGQDGSDFGVFARRFNSSGVAVGSDFQVNTYVTQTQAYPRIAAGANGEILVVWVSNLEIVGRRLEAGVPEGTEFQVNTYTTSAQSLPAAAVADDGSFVVVWQSVHDGAPAGIFARRFDSTGAALTGEFQVNTHTVGTQHEADIASDGADFVAVWQSADQDGDNDGIFARRISGTGTVEGAEFQVNTYTSMGQRSPSVGMEADGDFVVAWRSFLQDGSSDGVFAQRFSSVDLPILDVDGDGTTAALTDGLLVLRDFFGLSGATLTSGAVDADCTRCDATAIAAYLDGLGLVLDIDDDSDVMALTDGLLVLRFLFGLTGETLTGGAVGGSCGRCDATTIEPYLQSLI